ncbi:MAG: twin arginine-targeting protein translocase TatB [Methylotenera sp. 24-45-7]|nr:MAG: twin arginine-targeting protein translocase TatB [Mehylophilales bacterium 35-46-6]OYZ40684.1 MAG: twin arginine-targeting protein translocase TatB [Methylotenera sp. 24-45-7]OZA07782.1 MAG: twin arginine-targeting protein translocase TatB [Methylotenera sp. 17-45-7]OZA49368.1 MAG: twin arginine-targeting protein translocase TatB [Methylophilales bacterium 39-45-7]HQS38076.1 Sec-independent protein translocase protein TatB [Methylotenera sp.]
MFDIAFSELIVIAIVALIVIGPEKLPKLARTLGAITGRMQKYMTQIKEEVNREARFAELQKLQNEIQSSVTAKQVALQSDLEGVVQDVKTAVVENAATIESKTGSIAPDAK